MHNALMTKITQGILALADWLEAEVYDDRICSADEEM